MGRPKGTKMTDEQNVDSLKAITDAFKQLYKTIETHAGDAGEEVIDTVKSQVAELSELTEQKMNEARKKAVDIAEENVKRAQDKLDELRKKYNM